MSRIPSLLIGCAATLVLPVLALADDAEGVEKFSLDERLTFSMYGRVGVGWAPSGEFVHGRTLNLTGTSLGGRMEEGDYLEPSVKIHFLKPSKNADAPYADAVVTPAMWAANGLYLGVTSNRFDDTVAFELGEAYVTAGNVLTEGLKFWGGLRFYRGTNVYLADYWYYNNLSSQGGGVQYGPIEGAVLLQTSGKDRLYSVDDDGDGTNEVQRQRTVFVGQYTYDLPGGHKLQALGEAHILPETTVELAGGGQMMLRSDYGGVIGVKGHADLGRNGSFNDLSLRYGRRIANGGLGGAPTWVTFGDAEADGRFSGAYSVEVVEHALYNVNSDLSLNGYGILHYGRGATDSGMDKFVDYAVGAQSTVYLHDQFHLINEASYQGFKQGESSLATAVKLTVAPTLVPSGKRDVWARPAIRLFYTMAFYNDAAVDQRLSPFLKTVGPESIAHYIGARAEWWL